MSRVDSIEYETKWENTSPLLISQETTQDDMNPKYVTESNTPKTVSLL